MTACQARTWITTSELVTCKLEHGHDDKHQSDAPFARWRDPVCCFSVSDSLGKFVWSVEETRELVAKLQHQLAALNPLLEAERRMIDAFGRVERLLSITDTLGDDDTAELVVNEARKERNAAHAEWIKIIRSRAAPPTCNDDDEINDEIKIDQRARAAARLRHQHGDDGCVVCEDALQNEVSICDVCIRGEHADFARDAYDDELRKLADRWLRACRSGK